MEQVLETLDSLISVTTPFKTTTAHDIYCFQIHVGVQKGFILSIIPNECLTSISVHEGRRRFIGPPAAGSEGIIGRGKMGVTADWGIVGLSVTVGVGLGVVRHSCS